MHLSSNTAGSIAPELRGRELPFDLSIVPNNLEADDSLSQSIALEAALFAQRPDSDEDARFFEQPVVSTSLHSFRRLYERNDAPNAIKQLTRRFRVDFNSPEFVTPSNSPHISWTVDRHFIDLLVCVGNDLGIGAILPNQSVNSFYSVKLDFSQKTKEFKAKNVKLGFDPSGSMLWIGYMPSADDIWIAWVPKDDEEVRTSGGSSCLSERHYRIAVMFFAFVLSKIGYRDTAVHTTYPNLADANAFKAATNLL